MRRSRRRGLRTVAAVLAVVTAVTVAACGSSSTAGAGKKSAKAALILKTFSNPYWVSMENSAKAEAARLGIELSISAGTTDSDTGTQINAIDNAIASGDAGIIITSNGSAVNSALEKARRAGLYTAALDTVPIPPDTVNITYATDNAEAGTLIGRYAAAKLAGKPADIALLDDLTDSVVSDDVERDHGFLEGMGIPVGNPNINGREPTSGRYTGGQGGLYKIACQLPTQGAIAGGKSAMQTCLQKDPNINVVYAINEPAAEGATDALTAAHHKAMVVTIDGGCYNLPYVANGLIAATAGQFPGKMAIDGVDAIYDAAIKHVDPASPPGLGFVNTGTTLYTDSPVPGVPSDDVTAAKKLCWG
jgi:fructose transport system substrate-binding protein